MTGTGRSLGDSSMTDLGMFSLGGVYGVIIAGMIYGFYMSLKDEEPKEKEPRLMRPFSFRAAIYDRLFSAKGKQMARLLWVIPTTAIALLGNRLGGAFEGMGIMLSVFIMLAAFWGEDNGDI